MTIIKLEKPNPCYGQQCDMPEPDPAKYGYGTIAACSRCGKQAKLKPGYYRSDFKAYWEWIYS